MNKLQLVFQKKEYPYSDEYYNAGTIWGGIELTLSENVLVVKKIFKIEWGILKLVN